MYQNQKSPQTWNTLIPLISFHLHHKQTLWLPHSLLWFYCPCQSHPAPRWRRCHYEHLLQGKAKHRVTHNSHRKSRTHRTNGKTLKTLPFPWFLHNFFQYSPKRKSFNAVVYPTQMYFAIQNILPAYKRSLICYSRKRFDVFAGLGVAGEGCI